MPQIFHPSTNTFSKASIFGAVFIIAGLVWALTLFFRSSYVTNVGVSVVQPVQFSHEHHVAGLGIDCLYCHTSVEESSFADIPPTHTCMSCHTEIWADSPELAPVRESFQTGVPIRWNRVYDLPDFVYFDHSVHVTAGVACSNCHGEVDEMPLIWKAETLYMSWCLECHRHPENYIQSSTITFEMNGETAGSESRVGAALAKGNEIEVPENLDDCFICHR